MKKVKIMCVGDSITHGSNGSANNPYFTSYRYPLWKRMIDAGYDFELVGPSVGNFDGDCIFEEYKGQVFENRHYARYGIKLVEVNTKAAEQCKDVEFDAVMINLGTNDRKTDTEELVAASKKNIPNMLAELTDIFRGINPRVKVFIGGLCDNWPVGINVDIERKCGEIDTAESPVVYVPAPAGWIAKPDEEGAATIDWTHPNEKGCQMMADTYFEYLKQLF